MKQETIKNAVKVINRSITFYQRKLTYQLELKAESEFDNANLKVASLGYHDAHIKKYECILADLATIKRAIKNDKTSVRIYGTDYNRGYIYTETSEVLAKAGFGIAGYDFGRLDLFSIDEMEENWVEGIPESWSAFEEEQMAMQLNGLMAEYEN